MNNWYADPVEGEVSQEEIKTRGDSGEFHQWGFQPFEFSMAENGYEDVIEKLKTYKATDYEKLSDEGKEKMVDEVLAIYRSVNRFPIQYYSEQGIYNEIDKCIAYKAAFDGDTVSCVPWDTEFFNGTEWKKICDYIEGEKVLQYDNKEEGTASLVTPLEYIKYDNWESFCRHSDANLPTSYTKDHDVAVEDSSGNLKKVKFFEIDLAVLKTGGVFPVKTTFSYKDAHVTLPENLISQIAENFEYDLEGFTGYLKLYDGIVGFSDKCFQLSNESRKLLWDAICDRVDLLSEEYESLDFVKSVVNYSNMNVLTEWGLMSDYNGKYIPEEDRYVYTFYRIDKTCFRQMYKAGSNSKRLPITYEYPTDDYRLKTKYCFTVPSGMLVLRFNGVVVITGNCGAGIGTTLCRYLFPNLFDTPSKHDVLKKGAESMYAKFHNDEYLRRAIKFCFSYKNGCPVPTSVEGGLRLVGSAPSNFRPMNAKAVYERFCPEGGTIYDFCCVSGDTEYFNGKRWKFISEYTDGEKVLQFNKDNTATLVKPEEYIHYESDEPFYEYIGAVEMPSCQTSNHDVVYFDKEIETYKKIKQSEILNGFDGLVPTNCVYEGNLTLSDLEISRLVKSLLNKNNDREELFEKGYSLTIECRYKLLKMILPPKDFQGLKLLTKFSGDTELRDFCCSLARLSGLCASSGKDFFMLLCNQKHRGEGVDGAFHIENCYSKYLINKDISKAEGIDTRKCNARFVKRYEKDKYCFVVPSHMLVLRRKGKVYITGNCGFGGRMLGALSSKKNFKYVGTDPNVETMYHLQQLGEYIEAVTGREDSYELHCCGSEDFKGNPNSIDFAFSSPPYFDLEVYSDDPTQCYNKFPKLDEWLEGYVRQTIKNIKYMLKPGKFYAVNIADFKVGSGGECAYVDEWIRLSTEEGMPLFDTVYLGVTARAGSKEQAAGELKKENILIFKKSL